MSNIMGLQYTWYTLSTNGGGVRVKMYNATFNNISVISWWSVWTIEPRPTTKVHFMYWLNGMHYITCLVRQTVWCFTSSSGSQCCIDKMTADIS